MKTTVILFVSVFMVAATIKTSAQITGTKPNPKSSTVKADASTNRDANVISTGGGVPTERMNLPGIESQVYIGANWPEGIIVLRDGGIIDNYFLRYDILADQMQFIAGKDTVAFASPKELRTISFEGHTFVYEIFQCDNTIRNGYFELVEPGKNKLLLKRLVTYMIPDASDPDEDINTRYYVDECYFISMPGKPASKVMCNRKSVLFYLNEHNQEIEEYLRITGNKVKTPEDLKKLVAYYNSLDENH